MSEDELLHEELLSLFREYYKANLVWKTKHTRQAAIDTRNLLSRIRAVATRQRVLIQEWRYNEWEQNIRPKRTRVPKKNDN